MQGGTGEPPPALAPQPGDDAESLGTPGSPETPISRAAARSSRPRPRRRRLPWAELLMRVLFVDALSCVKCSTPMVVLAFLSDPSVVAKILRHLGLPDTAPPLAAAHPGCGGGSRLRGISSPTPHVLRRHAIVLARASRRSLLPFPGEPSSARSCLSRGWLVRYVRAGCFAV